MNSPWFVEEVVVPLVGVGVLLGAIWTLWLVLTALVLYLIL